MFSGFLILLTIKHVHSARTYGISGHVLGGDYTNINKYPHAVYLIVRSEKMSICGGSILNQDILLTAAHCFNDYPGTRKDKVIIKYGGTSVQLMTERLMCYYRLHDDYDEVTFFSDIGLVRPTFSLRLTKVVKRVAIMMQPPEEKLAYVAGWGTIDEEYKYLSKGLKHTKQTIQSRNMCWKYFIMPRGTFCAGGDDGEGHPNVGDAGGALMVDQYIQVGIVSFKEYRSTLVVYTNVSYYYAWIKQTQLVLIVHKNYA